MRKKARSIFGKMPARGRPSRVLRRIAYRSLKSLNEGHGFAVSINFSADEGFSP